MQVEQVSWSKENGWSKKAWGGLGKTAQLVLMFGDTDTLKKKKQVSEVVKAYPKACVIGCSTAGEICGVTVCDGTIVSTAVHFDKTQVKCAKINIKQAKNSFDAGEKLVKQLPFKDLVHVFVLSDGQKVNGSELTAGMLKALPKNVAVTGGLAGDGARFKQTLVFADGEVAEGNIVVIGFYGKHLRVGYGSLGGWDAFGPEREITKSDGNVLYELDGNSALELYKKYLGREAKGLPATGLFFPLSIRSPDGKTKLVRTILNVSEKDQSMTFAGDVPEGYYAQFMKANMDRLVDGAHGAAEKARNILKAAPELALLVSCVGRKLVLKQRVEDEVEGVRSVLGKKAVITGFYSYGEICPSDSSPCSELHNQTMTITVFSETR